MAFNRGFFCQKCGPMATCDKRSIAKVQRQVCKICGAIVSAWERPLNERAGRCSNCGKAHFELSMHKSHLLRRCRACNEVYNTDTAKIVRKGQKVGN